MLACKASKTGFAENDSVAEVASLLPLTRTGNSHPLTGKAGQIFEEIEQRLAAGHYRFGDMLSVVELASEFAASRQPVTVALNHLRSLGYLLITPQVGCRVSSPTTVEIRDFFYLLGKIQSAVAGLAAERHVDGEAQALAGLADAIEAIAMDEPENVKPYAQLIDTFHETMAGMARSTMLSARSATLWRMSDFMMWQGMRNLTPPKAAVANEERHAIVESISRRDVKQAESRMEQHVRAKPVRVGIL